MFSDTFDVFRVLSHGIVTFAKALLEIFDCVQSNHTVALRGLLKGRNLQIMEIIGNFFALPSIGNLSFCRISEINSPSRQSSALRASIQNFN